MGKGALGVVAGLAVWIGVTTIAGFIMRESWPAYASVAEAMTFTLPMMIARLTIGAAGTLAGGRAAAAVARRSDVAPLVCGVLLLAGFIPVHIGLWAKFPVWYHLTFLLSLVPLSYLGGRLGRA
jgi:hypothetical protein